MNANEPNGPIQWPERPSKLTEEELEQLRDIRWGATDPEVQKQYPDEFVAVYKRRVIAHGDNELKVLEEAERITGLPRHKIAITTVLGPGILFAPR
jgi:hypothetical protein